MFKTVLETKFQSKLCTYHKAEYCLENFRQTWNTSLYKQTLLTEFGRLSKHLNLWNLVILVSFSELNVLKLLFTQSKNEVPMRQSKKERWLPNLRQSFLATQPIRGLPPMGLIWQNKLQIVPKNGLLYMYK